MIDLLRAAPYLRLHRGRTFVVKVGGACLVRPGLLRRFARQVAVVESCGVRVVVVHGGGPQTDHLQRALGEEPRMVEGRRVTSGAALRALRMTTAGELNGDLAAAITAEGAPAVGLCAGTGELVVARRRPPVATPEGVVDFGEVGDVERVDPAPLDALLHAHITPVVAPPAADGQGGFLNVNADVTAAALAVALKADKLVLATSAAGILTDPADATSLVSTLTLEDLDALDRQGSLARGMRVKADAIRAALAGGVARVHVVSGLEPDALLGELYTTHGSGTLITREPQAAPEPAELAP